jgi:hypothetical protein
MTLGCESGYSDGSYQGYIEFSFRDLNVATNVSFISGLDTQLEAWAAQTSTELVAAVRSCTRWEYAPFSYLGTPERLKIAL